MRRSKVGGFIQQNSYEYDDLISCAKGELFGKGNAQLPMPPMLMVDRITTINGDGGSAGKGEITAEFDITPDKWFFDCHFIGDPVMPGCLGMDGLWQLLGFYLAWAGGLGKGRALSVGQVKFGGEITPKTSLVRFNLDITRLIMRRMSVGVAEGLIFADGEQVFEASDIRVGLLQEGDAS